LRASLRLSKIVPHDFVERWFVSVASQRK